MTDRQSKKKNLFFVGTCRTRKILLWRIECISWVAHFSTSLWALPLNWIWFHPSLKAVGLASLSCAVLCKTSTLPLALPRKSKVPLSHILFLTKKKNEKSFRLYWRTIGTKPLALAYWVLSLLPLTCGLKTALLLVRMNLELLALQAYYLRLWGSTINIRLSRQWVIRRLQSFTPYWIESGPLRPIGLDRKPGTSLISWSDPRWKALEYLTETLAANADIKKSPFPRFWRLVKRIS